MYHIENMKPKHDGICDNCGRNLVQRDDDQPAVIQKRLAVYHQQTEPLVNYYERKGCLKKIDALRAPQDVSSALDQILGAK